MRFIFLIFLVFPGSVVLAQFAAEQIISTEAELPVSIAIVDIDGDGFLDVVSGSRYTNGVAWFKNIDGQGSFGPLQLIDSSPEIWNVKAADLDGDDDIDVIVSAPSLDRVFWHENLDGLGVFGPQRVIDNAADNVNDAIAADIDGDGDLDIVSAIDFEQSAVWYENKDGLGNFYPRKYISFLLLSCRSVFPADIDNDGDLDVVANSAGNVTISWFENIDGQGNFGPQHIVNEQPQPTYVSDVFCADIDGDGDLDIIGAANGENRVLWHENLDGLGAFGPQRIVTNEALSCTSIFCVDLDNDGDIDVVFGSTFSSNEENSEVAWCENLDGSGNFGAKQVIGNTLQLTRAVYAADIDGDTDMDVFAASQNNNKVVWYENLTVLGVTDNSLVDIKVYPNPSSDKIFIDSTNKFIDQVVIYDILGKQLFSKHENVKEVDISHLQNGMYFLRIATDNGELIKKIIKE